MSVRTQFCSCWRLWWSSSVLSEEQTCTLFRFCHCQKQENGISDGRQGGLHFELSCLTASRSSNNVTHPCPVVCVVDPAYCPYWWRSMTECRHGGMDAEFHAPKAHRIQSEVFYCSVAKGYEILYAFQHIHIKLYNVALPHSGQGAAPRAISTEECRKYNWPWSLEPGTGQGRNSWESAAKCLP